MPGSPKPSTACPRSSPRPRRSPPPGLDPQRSERFRRPVQPLKGLAIVTVAPEIGFNVLEGGLQPVEMALQGLQLLPPDDDLVG